jgi:hypothetical protein
MGEVKAPAVWRACASLAGICFVHSRDASVKRVFPRADEALYAAKQAGGNQTSIDSAPAEHPEGSESEQGILSNGQGRLGDRELGKV